MKDIWRWKTFRLGWSVFWRSAFWGGPALIMFVFWLWPKPITPWSIASNLVWIGGWGVMSEGIAVRLAMKKWAGRLDP